MADLPIADDTLVATMAAWRDDVRGSDAPVAHPLDDYVSIRVDQIDADEARRLRPIDPVWAEALGGIMLRDGQETPIQVCRLPGSNRWTLVTGGHRWAGAVSAGIEYLKASIVGSNASERRRREISENLHRQDLDPFARAENIAELVAIFKARAGIDPTKDGRTASIAARWQKQLKTDAADTNVMMTVVYGWADEVAEKIGISKSTVERDLLLHRRLSPSLVARLRDARHPIVSNATQLRALAKLDEARQDQVVGMLLRGMLPPKSVGDAVKQIEGRVSRAPDDKRQSTVLSTLSRMSAAERIGLFQSPLFHNVIPEEARRLLKPMLRDGSEIGETSGATSHLSSGTDSDAARMAGHGRSARVDGNDPNSGHRDGGAEGEGQFIDNLAVAGAPGRAGASAETLEEIPSAGAVPMPGGDA